MNCCRTGWVGLSLLLLAVSPAWAQKSPEEELKNLQVADGFDISLFASEPMITNPAVIDIDTKGRVWVAEIEFYRKFANKPPADKIKVLEDTDGDGKADKMTVFAEGVYAPMSICVAGDKVFVATSPDLWLYEDKDGDLKADGPPKKLLTGFGGFNHDHGAHSLVLGPDHKWWMAHGDQGFKVTGTDGSKIEFKWGAMLRGELDGSKLETVAVNFRNPYEICMSSFGEAYCSDNDNDGNFSVRICWILDGGNYGWFGGPPFNKAELDLKVPVGTPFRDAWHFRGYQPGYVPGTLVTGFGSPCGICFYEGDVFGAKYKNAPLHADAGPREVRVYRHENAGAGKKATSEVFLTSKGDNYFRPDDICTAPNGALFVSDWYDGGVGGHAYNNPDQGRIFMLTPVGKKLTRQEKPGPYDNIPDAIEGLKSPNLATQYLARERLLAEGMKSVPALEKLLSDTEPNFHARALWVLDRLGGEARKPVLAELKSQDPQFRALAVRIIRRHGEQYGDDLLALANDSSGEVRREVLLAIKNLKSDKAAAALEQLALTYDGADRYLLETINIAAGENKADLYARLEKNGKLAEVQFSLLQLLNPSAASAMLISKLNQSGVDEKTSKALLEAAGSIPSLDAGRGVLELLGNASAPVAMRRMALDKLAANLNGSWAALASEDKLSETFGKLLKDKELAGSALTAIGSLGLTKLGPAVLDLAKSPGDAALRGQAIDVVVQLKLKGAEQAIPTLLADAQPAVRQAALNALVDLQDIKTLREVLAGGKYPAEMQTSAADRLMESTGGALVLLRLVDAEQVPSQLKSEIIAKATKHPDSNIRVLYEKFIPESQRPQRLGGAIKAEEILALKGDAKRGEAIFNKSSAAQCKNCHMVRGVGGTLGPDLSMIGKKYERNTLLETILDPSKAIAPEFMPYILETSSGQVYAGFLVQKDDKSVVLKDIKSQLIRVPADEIEVLAEQKKSLMPELVLRDVTAQDAADLLAFLTSLNQGEVQVGSFRVLGPFDTNRKNLDDAYEPESTVAQPDLNASYKGVGGKPVTWELATSDGSLGFPGIDTVKYDKDHGQRGNAVTHYFLVYADSSIEQPATLLVGSDDGCKVWVNGQMIHRNSASRALAYGSDQVETKLNKGRNVIVVKVVNGNPPGGVSLGIRASSPLQVRTE